jgi:serine protease
MNRWFAGCRRSGLLAGWAVVVSAGALAQAPKSPPVDGLIVKLKNAPAHERMQALGAGARSTETSRLQRVIQTARVTEVRTRPAGRAAQHFHFGRQLPLAEAQAFAERLRSQPEVEWVELNVRERLLQAAPVPNDTYYGFVSPTDTGQWWLRPAGESDAQNPASWGAPGIQTAWGLTTGRAAAIVAVLDTGRTNHSELTGRFLPGYDFVSEVVYANDGNGRDTDPSDPGDWVSAQDIANNPADFGTCVEQLSSWHGTVISGIVAAQTNNTTGVAGINWNGRVLPVRVAGKCGASVLDITDGMRWAAGLAVAGAPTNTNPARIVNISFGGSAACGNLYQDTIDELASHGVVVVAAAGNEQGAVTRPASCAGVVGVAALARDGLKAGYSNLGARVVVSTVGGDPDIDDGILTVFNTGTQSPDQETYANLYGTSFSAPIVSGVVSLMLSANANLSVPQIISGLQVTARPHVLSSSVPVCSAVANGACQCTTSTCGAGVLDAEAAVRYAVGAPPPSSGGDSGGGALSWPWLLGLALGVIAAARASGPRSGSRGAQRKRLAQ